MSKFVKAVQNEATKPGIAPSNAFVLVEWFSILIQACTGTEAWTRWGLDLISSDAQALELCQSSSSRPNVRHSALVVTRRALRQVFSHEETREKSIHDAVSKLTAKNSQPVARNAIMLGVIAGVCARKPDAKTVLESTKAEIYAFYTREILGSRTPVPEHIATSLHDFFIDFATNEDVEGQLAPSFEKGLLRAPEIVLDLITPFFNSLPTDIDLSNVLCNRLMKPFLSNIKSSNVAIRNGAIAAFRVAVSRCHLDEPLSHISDEILNPLKGGKLSAADQRALHAEMLAAMPISEDLAKKILPAIATVITKESSEVALSTETLVLTRYINWCLDRDINMEKVVLDTFAKGIADKKIPIRRLWAMRFGEILWANQEHNMKNSSLVSIAEAVLPGLIELWNEILSNPVAAAQTGLVTVAFILTALSSTKLQSMQSGKIDAGLKKAQISQHALTFEPKPSYLLNHRIYAKLSNEDDFLWLMRALAAVSGGLTADAGSPAAIAWSQAMIFCICTINSTPAFKRQAIETLSRTYVLRPKEISSLIINGLWKWLQSLTSGDKDSAAAAAKTENSNLHLVVKSICLPPTESGRFGAEVGTTLREQQMVSMLVISRPELLPHISWIDLCLRVEVDPGDLARKYSDALVEQILTITSFDQAVRISISFIQT